MPIDDDWRLEDEPETSTGLQADSEYSQALMIPGGQVQQRIQTPYATAISVQQPRELKAAKRRLLEEAVMAGEDFYYGWTVYNKQTRQNELIEGPSVKLAMAAARNWGNCAVDPQPLQETADAFVFAYHFVDLETGFTVGRSFRISKRSQLGGKMDSERKDDIRFQIGQSKACRNVILNALPSWYINAAMKEAKRGVRIKVEQYVAKNGLVAAVDMVAKALAKHGVDEAAILEKLMIAERKGITVDHIVLLRGDLMAIHEGMETAADLFPAIKQGQQQGNTREQTAADLEQALAKQQAAKQQTAGNGASQEPAKPQTEQAETQTQGETAKPAQPEKAPSTPQEAKGKSRGKKPAAKAQQATAGQDGPDSGQATGQQTADAREEAWLRPDAPWREAVEAAENLEQLHQLRTYYERQTSSPDQWFEIFLPAFEQKSLLLVEAAERDLESDELESEAEQDEAGEVDLFAGQDAEED